MARFHGNIGYVKTTEVSPGIWQEVATEREYYGDVTKNRMNWAQGSGINDDILIANTISIVADSYAEENIGYMKYVFFGGFRWKLSSIETQFPRIILTLGGVWNGVTPTVTDPS